MGRLELRAGKTHYDGSPACRVTATGVKIPVIFVLRDDSRNDEVAHSHPDRTYDQNGLSAFGRRVSRQCALRVEKSLTPLVQVEHGWNGSEEQEDTDYARCQERCGIALQIEAGCGQQKSALASLSLVPLCR